MAMLIEGISHNMLSLVCKKQHTTTHTHTEGREIKVAATSVHVHACV